MQERKVVAVCCFKADRYRWFDLPRPMSKREAERWTHANVDMPAENFRYQPEEQ